MGNIVKHDWQWNIAWCSRCDGVHRDQRAALCIRRGVHSLRVRYFYFLFCIIWYFIIILNALLFPPFPSIKLPLMLEYFFFPAVFSNNLNDLYQFNLSSLEWTNRKQYLKGSPPSPHIVPKMATCHETKKIYLLGGTTAGGALHINMAWKHCYQVLSYWHSLDLNRSTAEFWFFWVWYDCIHVDKHYSIAKKLCGPAAQGYMPFIALDKQKYLCNYGKFKLWPQPN